MRKLLFILVLVSWQGARAMDLQEYLHTVEQRHGSLRALEASEQAVEAQRAAGDVELAPSLSFDANYTDDKKEPNQLFQFGVTESKVTQYSLGFNKKFSTGTTLGLSANAYEFENPGVRIPSGTTLPAGFYLEKYGTGSLGISLSQSLWKNFFGDATRLRWERENQVAASQTAGYDLQRRQLLIGAESAYWDYVYAAEELKIQQGSLDRAQKIENWTRRRVRDGISDRADLLQTQALVAQRQLLLLNAQNDFLSAQKALRDYLEIKESEPFPDVKGDLSGKRSLQQMVGAQGKIVELDAYVAALDARAKAATAREVENSYRPDLTLHGAYSTNSYRADLPRAVDHWGDANHPTTTVGVSFDYMFDTGPKGAAQEAARQQALAARLTSERKMLESESAWSELNRQYNELEKQIRAAQSLSEFQSSRARAEVDKLNKGRAITTDVVNSEQDAADAELTVTKLKTQQRKLEAQGRMYIAVDQGQAKE